ncbi:MAG: acyl-CoA synthetase [Desulfobacterales bacterium]|nr:MAG: acyl-CoA synthetase [Desulfobacterales bacterium]
MNQLDAIFSPNSIAVVGASTTPGKVGYDIFANILNGGFKGVIYPVNPRAKSVMSVRAYASLTEIPDQVDLGILIVPPRASLQTVKEGIEKGIKAIVIVSAGFKEVGGEGMAIEEQIVKVCAEAGVPLVGPNCLGVINPLESVRMNASFSNRMPKAGNISFISQSGALCASVLDFAADRDFGFSKFISIGNKADVDELDLLRYFHEDPDTEVIMMYMEELKKGPEFVEAVREITSGDRPTPILVIKSGRTSAGAQAAASHTGALAGSEAVYDAIFEQAGIIRVDSINDLFDFASTFAYKNQTTLGKFRRKIPDGNRVAIVTNAGGPGIVATDMTVSSGLRLAEFNEDTVETLASHLPPTANLHNPVDVIGDAAQDRYEHALRAVIHDENVDGALVILTPQSMTNALGTAEAVVQIARRTHKPILCCFMGVVDVSQGIKHLQENGIPVFRFPESAARAMGTLYKYSKWMNRQYLAQFPLQHDTERASAIIRDCLDRDQTKLGELEGLELLQCYGFSTLPTELASTEDEAAAIAKKMEFPVVMKIVSPQILHKSDAGGVKVGVADAAEARATFSEIMANAKNYSPDAELRGVLIQKMAAPGREVILGCNRYPIFGPLLMFGMGGIFVEVFKDVSFRLAPIGRNESRRMIRDIKGIKMLKEFRGQPAADIKILEKLLVCLSDLVSRHPEIMELDINPLLVHEEGKGATVADCRIILSAPAEDETPADEI